MESSAVLRSFHGTVSQVGSILERPGVVPAHNSSWPASSKSYKLISSPGKRFLTVVSSAKASEATVTAKSEVNNYDEAFLSESTTQSSLEKKTSRNATFPSGFEALVLEVCDETEIAELKLKVGDFEMHVKRNVGVTTAPLANISPTTPPPIPTEPMGVSAPVASSPSPPKPASEKSQPFTNISFGKSSKLAALEASGSNAYVLVSSPTVGSFRRNRTVKGKKQPPICKEGSVIKEGQVIGYLDQFGTELPVKSDVAGEVLKLLFDDGVLSSTHAWKFMMPLVSETHSLLSCHHSTVSSELPPQLRANFPGCIVVGELQGLLFPSSPFYSFPSFCSWPCATQKTWCKFADMYFDIVVQSNLL
ncbi:hypothetical protein JRO89_XS14G0099500 [Xanthoceras sorbifolium]|uniref:Biotin carboxyl carrier protein n=1 Tax=Xanthoceras sorbifolium TaxID=99658 RepID=A0ABQ8H4V5_9ROSI|nr:hypothetical protein JRO89_XS14G0099500 [Xanthoceras sorbifolium]